MIQLKDVGKSFSGKWIFRDLSFSVSRGESVALIGPSGSGKSVLLKIIAGLLSADTGSVEVQSSNIGMLFQKNALFDSVSVAENIAFPLREKTQLSALEIETKVAYFLEQVGLSHARDLFPDEISGGMQKRLGIARALALAPPIVLYDDPTAGLDPITSRRIVDLILRLRAEQHSTVIAVTNDMARAYQMADRIAMVVQGEVIITGNKSETMNHRDPRVAQFVRGQLSGPLTEETA